MLKTETVRVFDSYAFTSKRVREVTKQLDPTNIKILSTMSEVGPRNLLEVSRLTGIPFTTVYHRVGQIEAKSESMVKLVPRVSHLGLVRMVVLAAAKPGLESVVTEAWRIPNYWRVLERCEGAFTNYCVQLIPIKFMKEFREYISTMHAMNLIKSYRLIETGDPELMFPDFSNYNSNSGEWTFEWELWLNELTARGATITIRDKCCKPVGVQKMSLTMLAHLELNARMKFTEIAERIGTSPQTVKYHYDRLVSKGVADMFEFFAPPYPMELSVFHEFMLEFADASSMDRFFSLAKKLFFVIQVSKALRRNTLMVSTQILSSQVENLFAFFSEMTNVGLLNSYSGVRINFSGRQVQTISFELYDDVSGWQWDRYENLLKLNKL